MFHIKDCYPSQHQDPVNKAMQDILSSEDVREKLKEITVSKLNDPEQAAELAKRFFSDYNYMIANALRPIVEKALEDNKEFYKTLVTKHLEEYMNNTEVFRRVVQERMYRELYTLANLAVERSVKNRKKKLAPKRKSAKKI